MSKASDLVTYSLELGTLRPPYALGNEPWYDVGAEPNPDPMAGDCSGTVYSLYRRAGVLVDGKPLPRETAHDYYRRAERISQPSKIGDLGFQVRDGRAYHVFMFIGDGRVIEGGDGTHHIGLTTVAKKNSQGAVWGRLNTDIEEGDDMDEATVRKIVREEVDKIYSPDVEAAQKHLVSIGLLSAVRPADRPASWGLVALMVSRACKLIGGKAS